MSLPFIPQRGDMVAFSESLFPESESMVAARARGEEFGFKNPARLSASLVRFLAELIGATSIVEIGTGTGVGGLYLLDLPEVNLTSIDAENAQAKAARRAFEEAGIPATRYRLITGSTKEVIGKLADNSYDIFVVRETNDGQDTDYLVDVISEIHRSLRPGGLVILDGILGGGKVADPTQRDDLSLARREAIRSLRSDAGWRPLLLPLVDGVMIAIKKVG